MHFYVIFMVMASNGDCTGSFCNFYNICFYLCKTDLKNSSVRYTFKKIQTRHHNHVEWFLMIAEVTAEKKYLTHFEVFSKYNTLKIALHFFMNSNNLVIILLQPLLNLFYVFNTPFPHFQHDSLIFYNFQ